MRRDDARHAGAKFSSRLPSIDRLDRSMVQQASLVVCTWVNQDTGSINRRTGVQAARQMCGLLLTWPPPSLIARGCSSGRTQQHNGRLNERERRRSLSFSFALWGSIDRLIGRSINKKEAARLAV